MNPRTARVSFCCVRRNRLFGKIVRTIERILPRASMIAILPIIPAVVGGTQMSIASVGLVGMPGVGLYWNLLAGLFLLLPVQGQLRCAARDTGAQVVRTMQ